MTSSQSSSLQLAKQGDPRAISAFINHSLRSKGVTTKAVFREGCLQIRLEAAQLPHSSSLISFIQKQIASLEIDSIDNVKVYGYEAAQEAPSWVKEFKPKQVWHNSTESTVEPAFLPSVTKNEESLAIQKPEVTVAIAATVMKVTLGICGLLASVSCWDAGSRMQSIESQSGNSVAEAYYRAMGHFVFGLSFFVGPMLIYFSYSIPPQGFDLPKKKK